MTNYRMPVEWAPHEATWLGGLLRRRMAGQTRAGQVGHVRVRADDHAARLRRAR